MKAANEAMMNKEMGIYKASRFFHLHKQLYRVMLKTGKAQVKQ